MSYLGSGVISEITQQEIVGGCTTVEDDASITKKIH